MHACTPSHVSSPGIEICEAMHFQRTSPLPFHFHILHVFVAMQFPRIGPGMPVAERIGLKGTCTYDVPPLSAFGTDLQGFRVMEGLRCVFSIVQ